jgi:TolB-like protein
VRPDPLGRAQAAARRAVELSPGSALASQALAQSLFFRKELDACRPVAERTIALNPMDGAISAFMGILLALSGDWARGCAAAQAAMSLNPHFPGWYWLAPLFDAYNRGDYREAIAVARRVNIPGYFWVPVTTAAAFGQLGDLDAARNALADLLAIRSDFGWTARVELGKWFQPDLVERYLDGLRSAGLDVAPATEAADASTPARTGGVDAPRAAPADEGFWVAVLPFRYSGATTDVASLAEGLSEELVTGLSRFSYLHVKARDSTARAGERAAEARGAGRAVGARYVMEGSLREAGSQLRVAVQLVDATTGTHLWAETYHRRFEPEATFELQDDLVSRIVSTVADWYGVLPRSMSGALRGKQPDQLSPYEAVLRSFGYSERRTPEEHALGRAVLERAVHQAPGYADAWALLSILQSEEYATGFNPQPDPLGRALQAARRAVDADGSNAPGHFALARARFFRKEFKACRTAAERAIALNPRDGGTIAFVGVMTAYAGDWEQGCALVRRAAELNPRHPGWYWFPLLLNAYRTGDYAGALAAALEINLPHFFYTHVMLAAVHGQLGDRPAAVEALRELQVLRPDFAVSARHDLGRWYPPDLVDHLIDGLRKAGLDVVE